ncbi:hypothetical protein ACP4OV_008133 [Aristida adscensionis]
MAADAARLFLVAAVLAAALAGRSDGAWCVCRTDLPDAVLQKTLDYACGAGADCKPVLQGGACSAPDTVKAHCSYAVNSFYQRNNQNAQACVFSGTAALISSDPSANGCQYPASPSAAGTSTTGGSSGTYSPPIQGPSAMDSTSGAGILTVTGVTKQMVIMACFSLMVLYLRA